MCTFGVIIGTRGFFPSWLAEEARQGILEKLSGSGHQVVILSEKSTRYGAVESYEDAKKCAALFTENRQSIDGIIVILPNFSDEVGIVNALDMANLNVPVLVQACDDDLHKLDLNNRRDAFCGKLSVCNNLYQYRIKFTDTMLHTCAIASEEFTGDIDFFARVCRVVKGMRRLRVGAIGARPGPFQTVRYSEKLLQSSGITTCVVDLSEIIFSAQKMGKSAKVTRRVEEIKAYGHIPSFIDESKILKQAKISLVLEKWLKANDCQASAIQCWSSLEENFGCAPCLAMSMMGENGMPSACEMDITGAVTMYALFLASGHPSGYHHYGSVDPSIRPLFRVNAVGVARTGRYVPYEGPTPSMSPEEYTEWIKYYYNEVCTDLWAKDIQPGDFICLDVAGVDVGIIGSNNSLNHIMAGAVGYLLNGGGVRDTDELIIQKVPVWSKFISQPMDQARIRFVEKDVPIAIGGAAVYPGDVIVADGDGVIVVPRKIACEVAKYARAESNADKARRRIQYLQLGWQPDETVI